MSGAGPRYDFRLRTCTIQWAISVSVRPLKMQTIHGRENMSREHRPLTNGGSRSATRRKRERSARSRTATNFATVRRVFIVLSDLTAEGRSGRADGRAKSPVLNASAVALVKMADCVS